MLGRLLVARAPSEAWPLLQRSLELGPDDPAALRMYADALAERARTSRSVVESRELLERAVSHYQRSLEVEPDQASAHLGLADGSFDGFISLAQGRNELEIQAIMADGRVVAEHRTVFYERPQSPTQADLEQVEQLRATLRERTLETELARRASHPRPEERPRTLEVEIG